MGIFCRYRMDAGSCRGCGPWRAGPGMQPGCAGGFAPERLRAPAHV